MSFTWYICDWQCNHLITMLHTDSMTLDHYTARLCCDLIITTQHKGGHSPPTLCSVLPTVKCIQVFVFLDAKSLHSIYLVLLIKTIKQWKRVYQCPGQKAKTYIGSEAEHFKVIIKGKVNSMEHVIIIVSKCFSLLGSSFILKLSVYNGSLDFNILKKQFNGIVKDA